MKEGKFPESEKDKNIVEALIKGGNIAAASVGLKYIPSPVVIPKEKKASLSSLEAKKIILKINHGSIPLMIFEILKERYPKMGLALKSTPSGSRRNDFYLEVQKNNFELVSSIFAHPIMRVLEMNDPEIDYEMGFELEKQGLLPEGVTKKSYLRYLFSEIKKSRESKDPKVRETVQKHQQEVNERGLSSVEPLTDQEANVLVEQVVGKILDNQKPNL